jgi:cysteine desulfurase
MSKKRQVYLDHAAATPLDDDVQKAMRPYLSEEFYNPSAIYSPARKVRLGIETARQKIAENIGVKKGELIFTAGATEANNLAVFGATASFLKGHIIISAIEHDSILKPIEHLISQGRKVSVIKPDKKGIVDVDDVISKIKNDTVFISIIMANNEIGTIQPISKIADKLNQIRSQRKKTGNGLPLIFHTDAAQAVNYLDTQPKRLGVDLMSFNGSKIYGPKQIGCLYAGSHIQLAPIIFGGGQERGYRSGTENPAYIAGFASAMDKTIKIRKIESLRLAELQRYFIGALLDNFRQASINGSLKKRLPNNVHVTFEGVDNERLIYELDENGVYAASGSACSEASEDPSHVLSAIGLSGPQAESSIRCSMGRGTEKEDIDYVLSCLKQILS